MPGTLETDALRTLPGDDVRQVMWRFTDKFAHQMLVQSSRGVARGHVARLVAAGVRASHEWTPEKASLLEVFDEAGITALYLDPERGRVHRRAEELRDGARGLRAGVGRCGSGHLQHGRTPRAGTHPREGHARAARVLSRADPAAAARRRPQDVARRVLPDRAHPVRGGRDGPAQRQGVDQGMARGRGADPAGREARSLHHQHGVRELRHGGRRLGRPAHQGQLHGHSRRDRSRALRPRPCDAQARAPALVDPRSGLQPHGAGQPHRRRIHGARRA